ncbi:MAG: peptidoglycan DD-metalloendopeptidase family protein [Nitrospirota bacterium]|jgi:murein DD-endopeptidase MepM/ murein hydrolase activator NlpD
MKIVQALALAVLVIILAVSINGTFLTRDDASNSSKPEGAVAEASEPAFTLITEKVKSGESLFDIFSRRGLRMDELHNMVVASRDVYDLDRVVSGRSLTLEVDPENRINSLTYNIDGDHLLKLTRSEEGFRAEKEKIPYETTVVHMSGTVEDNLVFAMDDLLLALELSDIFAWDIDFTTDLRRGDTFKIVVEELKLDGEFKKYGRILAAEFTNNGHTHYAYRFEQDGRADYFDQKGRSLRKAFLKAPLSYRRISSGFTHRRLHPVLRIYRPHLGIDYAAPTGTPVSAVGDGTVIRSGYKGANGNQVIIKHPNGFVTYYGHLSRIKKGIRAGRHVAQGEVIGYVGSTGRATGPHLDYRVKKNGRFVNPLTLDLPPGKPIEKHHIAQFRRFRDTMNTRLASIELPVTASSGKPGEQG